MKILIKNGLVINPSENFNQKADVLIENGKIADIGVGIQEEKDMRIINVEGCIVTPGLIDLHVHFRDPGFLYKEEISTGMDAAAAGGFTTVVVMPNTNPTVDNIQTLSYVLDTAREKGRVNVYSASSISKKLQGKELVDMKSMADAGAVMFIDDSNPNISANLLYEAYKKSVELQVPITSNDKSSYFKIEGSFNRGKLSSSINDKGYPAIAEELAVARDLLFAEDTGARIHLQSISTERSIQLIREAKKRGVKVTAEGSPHHFAHSEEIVLERGTNAKVIPPLRSIKDMEAVIKGLQDGTLDVIASDHAPHSEDEKNLPLCEAPFGLLGLETSLGAALTYLVHSGKLSIYEVIEKMTINPAKAMNLKTGKLINGGDADITIIDPELEWIVDGNFKSKSKNSLFIGEKFKGKVIKTICKGHVVYEDENAPSYSR
jgi:dihydroorotase